MLSPRLQLLWAPHVSPLWSGTTRWIKTSAWHHPSALPTHSPETCQVGLSLHLSHPQQKALYIHNLQSPSEAGLTYKKGRRSIPEFKRTFWGMSLVVERLRICLQCTGCAFDPWLENWHPPCSMASKPKPQPERSPHATKIHTAKWINFKGGGGRWKRKFWNSKKKNQSNTGAG